MERITLGDTGISVTELCFGALPIGPSQKNVQVEEAARTIAYALERGINFIDTAQGYKTYPHIRRAMELAGIRPVLASKSYETTYAGMERAVSECMEGLQIDCVDIFYLHAARSGPDIFEERAGALQCLLDYKAKGSIKAVGISTHDRRVVELAAQREDMDMVFPILNVDGLGILHGTRESMERAIDKCIAAGKGVYLMKALAGGNLAPRYVEALDYIRAYSAGRAAIALGMVNKPEVDVATAYFNGMDVSGIMDHMEIPKKEFFVLKGICVRCGKCVEACHSDAITLDAGYPQIKEDRCLTCGYCVSACPQFAIRMV